ncbi:glyoxylate/hydroxypyruvate reductase A-like [Liolophura sinensis]|uniref:glyoxylate/hydroxypyruvate reductase A-like n=1 Tax=Liolophura sinensis TaxID=3198878 RepID=UPI00315800E5
MAMAASASRMSRPLICAVSTTKDFVTVLKQKSQDLVIKEMTIASTESIDNAVQEATLCEILVAENDVISKVLENPGKLKWIHSTWAGVDKLTAQWKKLPGVILTRTGHGFGQLIGEYVVGQIISWERDFHSLMASQRDRHWKRNVGKTILPLTRLNIGVLGVGEIGKRGWDRCEDVDGYRLLADLKDILVNCDYICNVLPSTPETVGLLNNGMLRNCEAKRAVFINVGRGDVISEDELIQAIRSEWLGGAILDVFEKEPLPADSPLWTEPGVIITPHCSGPTITSLATDAFLINYKRYMEGKDLLWKCDFERGY